MNLARDLNINVVAEGVETEDQANLLRLLNYPEAQSHLDSPPVPAEQIPALPASS